MENAPEQKRFLELSAGLAGTYEIIAYVLANLMPPIGIPALNLPVVVADVLVTFERVRTVLVTDQPITEDTKFLLGHMLLDWVTVSEVGARALDIGLDPVRLDVMDMALTRIMSAVEIVCDELGIDLDHFETE